MRGAQPAPLRNMASTLKMAVIPGDGTGPEVTNEALKILDTVAPLESFKYELTQFRLGLRTVFENRRNAAQGGRGRTAEIQRRVSWARSDIRTWRRASSKKACCWRCGSSSINTSTCGRYNCFPASKRRWRAKAPKDIDFVVVRENTEDLYCGVGGFLKKYTADEVATQAAVYTRKGCERCIRWAFEYTRKRNNPKGKMLTLVAKTNVLTFGHDLWWRAFQDVAQAISGREGRL